MRSTPVNHSTIVAYVMPTTPQAAGQLRPRFVVNEPGPSGSVVRKTDRP